MADVLDDVADTPSILLPCVSCNRTFRPEALAKHSKVCEKTLMKKRKKFDSSKQRIQGTDLAEFLPILPTFTKKTDKSPVRKPQALPSTSQLHSSSKTSLSSPKQENTKWREKHNELVQTIKAARMPPGQAPVIKPSDQETCPYCERSFGPKAYDRHLEWCKEKRTRIQPKSPASQRAKERLEARTKYRAPPVGKTKRSVSRDKIQPETSPQVIHTPVTIRKNYNKTTNVLESSSAPNINQNFVKGTPLRSSTRGSNVHRSTQSSRHSKTPRPNSSPKLNPDVVNEQVPEMTITGYGSPGEPDTMDLSGKTNTSSNHQVISTYEIDISGNIVATSTPHFYEEEECQEFTVSEYSPLGVLDDFESSRKEECPQIELNKTYTKDDLQELLDCSNVKHRPRKKKKVRATKSWSQPDLEVNKDIEIHESAQINFEEEFKNNIVDDYLSDYECLCNYKDYLKVEEDIKENQAALVETVPCLGHKQNKSNELESDCLKISSDQYFKYNLRNPDKEDVKQNLVVFTNANSSFEYKTNKSNKQGLYFIKFNEEKDVINEENVIEGSQLEKNVIKGSQLVLAHDKQPFNDDLLKPDNLLSQTNNEVGKVESVTLHSGDVRPVLVLRTLLYGDRTPFSNRHFQPQFNFSLIKIDVNVCFGVDDFKDRNLLARFFNRSFSTSNNNRLTLNYPLMNDCSSSNPTHKSNNFYKGHSNSQVKSQSKSEENLVFVFNSEARKINVINRGRPMGKSNSFPNLIAKPSNNENTENLSPSPAKKYKCSLAKREISDSSLLCEYDIDSYWDYYDTGKINFINLTPEASKETISLVTFSDFINCDDKNATFHCDTKEPSGRNYDDENGRPNELSYVKDRKETEVSEGSSDITSDSLDLREIDHYSDEELEHYSNTSSTSNDSLNSEQREEFYNQTKLLDMNSRKIKLGSLIIPKQCSPKKSVSCDYSRKSGCTKSVITKTHQTTTRKYECEETTIFDVVSCNTEQNSCFSKKYFKSTTIEKDSKGRSNILEHSKSVVEKTFTKHGKLERKTAHEDLRRCFKLSSTKSKERYSAQELKTTQESIRNGFQSDITKLREEKSLSLPQIEHTKSKAARPFSSELTTLSKDNNRNYPTTNSRKNSQSLNSLKYDTSHSSSKLPVLIKKVEHTLDKPKKSHWTEKYEKLSDSDKYFNKLKGHALSQESQKRGCKIVNRSSSSSQIAELKPEEEFLGFKRHKILSPIASESVSVGSSDMWSDSGSFYEVSDTVFVETSEEHISGDCSLINSRREIFDEITTNVSRRSRSDTVTLSSCRRNLQQSRNEVNDANRFLPPAEPWGQERYSRSQRSWRNESGPEAYDPYKSAERQMLELMEPQSQKLAPISKPPSLVSSPTSAFTKFTSSLMPEPLFISENDNDNISKVETVSHASSEKSDSPLTVTSPLDNYTSKDSNQNTISLSTLSLCSTISIESVDSNKNGFRNGHSNSARVPEKKTPVPLRRTVSAFESRKGTEPRRSRDPLRGILKMEDMLYGSNTVVEGERYFGSPIITGLTEKDDDDDHSSSGSLHKAVSDAETLNAEQELLKSMSEFEKIFSSSSSSSHSPSSPPLKLFPSLVSSYPSESMDRHDVDFHSVSHTGGPDSAYSSLNRKSPVGGEQEKEPEVARFCHECGAKYPVLAAKFCCQCGVRRLVI